MARKRLRPFLDEVISDVDLRLSAERVADVPASTEPLGVVTPEAGAEPEDDAGFPAPPWENPPPLAALPTDGVTAPPWESPPAFSPAPADGAIAPPWDDPPVLAALTADGDVASANNGNAATIEPLAFEPPATAAALLASPSVAQPEPPAAAAPYSRLDEPPHSAAEVVPYSAPDLVAEAAQDVPTYPPFAADLAPDVALEAAPDLAAQPAPDLSAYPPHAAAWTPDLAEQSAADLGTYPPHAAPSTPDLATPSAADLAVPSAADLMTYPAPEVAAPSVPDLPAIAQPDAALHAASHAEPHHAATLTDEAAGAALLGTPAETPTYTGRRRRRSATLLPPLPSPTDIPEDAPGRVAIFAIPGPPPTAPSLNGAHAAADLAPAPVTPAGGEAALAGWVPVLGLGVALVVLFVIGVLVTR